MSVALTESALLVALRRGDEAAFVSLVARHQTMLLRVARAWVRNPTSAEEVVQKTWLTALESLDGFEESAVVAAHVALRHSGQPSPEPTPGPSGGRFRCRLLEAEEAVEAVPSARAGVFFARRPSLGGPLGRHAHAVSVA